MKADDLVRKMKIHKAMKSVPLTSFDEIDIRGGSGKETKMFARCKCSYLDEMFDDVTADDSNYVTCIDNLLHDEKISRDEFDALNISTIIKGYDGSYDIDDPNVLNMKLMGTASELICSRLANLFGIKTQYVARVKGNPYCSIIVDFLKDKETIKDFKEFTEGSPSSYLSGFDISSWISPITNQIFFMTPDALFNPSLAKDDIDRVVEEFTKQYLFKKYIVHDSDLCSANIGFVVTPDGKCDVAPAFDFTNCLAPGVRTLQGDGLERDLEYLSKQYPDILARVVKDFELSFEKNEKMKGIIKKFAPKPELAKDYCNLVANSTINVVENAKIALKNKNYDNIM